MTFTEGTGVSGMCSLMPVWLAGEKGKGAFSFESSAVRGSGDFAIGVEKERKTTHLSVGCSQVNCTSHGLGAACKKNCTYFLCRKMCSEFRGTMCFPHYNADL